MTLPSELDFRHLTPQQFVELCADILKATPGFKNVSLAGVGSDLGCDIYAEEDWVTHSGYSETIRWLVQCKHYAVSGKSVGSLEVGDVVGFVDEHNADGVFFITSTNMSGVAAKKLQEINRSRRHQCKARYWSKYELTSRMLSTAQHILSKYFPDNSGHVSSFVDQSMTKDLHLLAFPDMSIMAYQVIRRLQSYGIQVSIFNDFTNELVRQISFSELMNANFDVILFFRAELFNMPISQNARLLFERHISRKKGFIFTPWAAWTVNAGINSWLQPLIPVDVTKLDNRHFEHHEEDVYTSWKPLRPHPVVDDMEPFDVRMTREFLSPHENAHVIATDRDDNPALVVSEFLGNRTVYVNCCSHNCLRMDLMPSPFEGNIHLEKVFWNAVLWASGRK